MALSKEMRLLLKKWTANTHWPKRLESLEILGIRGWSGQRIDFRFPVMAISGENGTGKSTILQCAASAYAPPAGTGYFASDFFPDTAWEKTKGEIRATVREGTVSSVTTIRKPGERWRGNPSRKRRDVLYVDLSRVQPVAARVGYASIAKPSVAEANSAPFDGSRCGRLSTIMGRSYAAAKMATTSAHKTREVPVVSLPGTGGTAGDVSGFHMGAGETTIVELLKIDPPSHSLVLIDEIETSLHPRAQRRLLRDLAELCRLRELQIILTTHSPYILDELPQDARAYIMTTAGSKAMVLGVSPHFAMTQMDDEKHPECDLYVEDKEAAALLNEVLVAHAPDRVHRVTIVPFGAANVGQALGQMVAQKRFPRPTLVFLDGDQDPSAGCMILPGGDSPERVVFGDLQTAGWPGLATRLGRDFAKTSDACSAAMTLPDAHDWIDDAASKLLVGGNTLWQAMSAEWVKLKVDAKVAAPIVDAIGGALP